MKKPRLVDRLRYAFDNSLSRGPIALVVWLGLASAALVLLATLVVWLARQGPPGEPFANVLWDILYQALTPNPVDPKLGPTFFLVTMLVVTLGSLLLVSILIGLMSASIDHRVQALRRGRSRVIEHDHVRPGQGHVLVQGEHVVSEGFAHGGRHLDRPAVVRLRDAGQAAHRDVGDAAGQEHSTNHRRRPIRARIQPHT